MLPDEVAKLRELATKATQGEWVPFLGYKNTFAIGIKDKHVDQVIAWKGFDGSHESKKKQRANCKYIAAVQPEMVLRILDELDACQAQLAKSEGTTNTLE